MIIAIMTLYHPTHNTVYNVANISEQVDKIILCDNSNVSNEELFENMTKCVYVSSQRNLGLSVAFNNILMNPDKYLINDDDFIIFFDQDSKLRDNHITNMIEEYERLSEAGINVGCMGPVYFNKTSNSLEIQKAKKNLSAQSFSVKSIITSSMMCKYSNLKAINFWNEEIFLDLADWDLCWRFIAAGYACCVTKVAVLEHVIGESEKKIGLIKLRVGKPFREYYQVRDCLYLLHKKYTPVKFRVRFLELLTIRSLIHLLFLDNKKERLDYIKLGIKDYRNNVHGALDKVC